MTKRIITTFIVFVLVFTSISFSFAAGDELSNAAERLVALKLLKGYEDGSLKLENSITRAEFATIAVRLIGKEKDMENKKGDTKFSDVKKDHWASGYINIAIEQGLVKGYEDNTFRPERNITKVEVMAVLVRILGYESSLNQELPWPMNYATKGTELGINKDLAFVPDTNASRGDVVLYIDRSLLIKLQ